MSEHRYDIRILESCVDPNPLMVKRQDPDNTTRFQTRERCALEIAAYVFNKSLNHHSNKIYFQASNLVNIILIHIVKLYIDGKC